MNLALHFGIPLLPPSLLWHKDETPLACDEAALLTTDRGINSMRAAPDLTERVTVYKVTCTVNGKEYVGITARTAEERWAESVDTASRPKSKRAFIKAIRKHGPENFVVEVIAVAFGRDNANFLERAFIVEFDCLHPRGYNLSTGGEGSVGRRVAEEGKANLSAAVKALWAIRIIER